MEILHLSLSLPTMATPSLLFPVAVAHSLVLLTLPEPLPATVPCQLRLILTPTPSLPRPAPAVRFLQLPPQLTMVLQLPLPSLQMLATPSVPFPVAVVPAAVPLLPELSLVLVRFPPHFC